MKHFLVAAVLASCAGLFVTASAVQAQSAGASNGAQHPKSNYYRRKGTRSRGSNRRGGYSYSFTDTINTYGDSNTLFGGANSFRDPLLDRQTSSGPFDKGFFFDSGVAPRGGNSPYLN